MNSNGLATVYIAPVDADPADLDAWTHLGFTTDVVFEDDDTPVVLPDERLSATFTMPVRVFRYCLPSMYLGCSATVSAIEEHAQRRRITAALAEALAAARLPCPLPFPDRGYA